MSPPGTAVDRGWAWVVLAGVHVSYLLASGYVASMGVFYVQWKSYFQTSATAASWLISLPLLVSGPLTPLFVVLSFRFGVRLVAMTGAAVCATSNIIGSFTSDIKQLYVCTAMTGVGAIMVTIAGSLILPRHFKRRYALANGASIVGITVGQMIFPLLIRLLMETYDWRGAMFILGALQLNAVAACALYRPIKPSSTPEVMESATPIEDLEEEYGSPGEPQKTRPGYLTVFTNVPMILNILALAFVGCSAFVNISHLPARFVEGGGSANEGATLLLILSLVTGATRLSHGWFIDRGLIGSSNLQLIASFIAALSTALNPLSDSFAFLAVDVAVTGGCIGVLIPLVLVAAKRLAVNESETSATIGLIWTTIYLSNGFGAIIAGKIFDATGNYTATYVCAGAIFLMAFILLAVVRLRQRHCPCQGNGHDVIDAHSQ